MAILSLYRSLKRLAGCKSDRASKMDGIRTVDLQVRDIAASVHFYITITTRVLSFSLIGLVSVPLVSAARLDASASFRGYFGYFASGAFVHT